MKGTNDEIFLKSYKDFQMKKEVSASGYYYYQNGKQDIGGEEMSGTQSVICPLNNINLGIYDNGNGTFDLKIHRKSDDFAISTLPHISFGPNGWYRGITIVQPYSV
jgi:hypothetical protein